MSNKGCNPEKKPETCGGESGFFGRLFGGGGETNACPDQGGKCKDCGLQKCNCNCALRDHLKECCGYGTLPKLIQCDVNPPKKQDECACAPAPAAANQCNFPPQDLNCNSAPPPPQQGGQCSGPATSKCPPMPPTSLVGCVPTWMCPPVKSGVPDYPAPAGVVILPISVGGRNASRGGGTGSGKCGECGGEGKGEKRGAPKVDKNCPMVRPRCGEVVAADEPKQGFFAKLMSLFGLGKK